MNFYDKLVGAADRNDSLLCVGLDPRPDRLPAAYVADGTDAKALLRWNQAVIEQTQDLVCAYKPNIAFYEALGKPGMELLQATLASIPAEIPVLLDAKRGDIGATAQAYARACFEILGADAVTLSPYLGRDSIDPFAAYEGKGLFVLCHTSNPSAETVQTLTTGNNREPLYLAIARQATGWSPNVGLVVGGTYPQALRAVREVAQEAWFLVPGIGSQGADLNAVVDAGLRTDGLGLIINVSRGVALAPDHGQAALDIRNTINQIRR